MTLGRDKAMHVLLGVLLIAAAMSWLWVASTFGIGPALAYVTTLGGIGYELQQRIRGEGEPSWPDAVATAAPGYVAWALLAWF